MSDLENELQALSEEYERTEKEVINEWYKEHKRVGRDGGPIQRMKEIQKEYYHAYKAIMERYEARGKE